MPSVAPSLAPSPNPNSNQNDPTNLRWVVCGIGVGPGLTVCDEGDAKQVNKDELHEVRCCKELDGNDNGWFSKCEEHNSGLTGRSSLDGQCHETTFDAAYQLCANADGRLCTKEEVEASCTQGTGCGHDTDLIWTCTEEGGACSASIECCSGHCNENGGCQPAHHVFFQANNPNAWRDRDLE